MLGDMTAPHDVFAPAKLGPLTLRNRIIKAATFEGGDARALVTDDLIDLSPAARGRRRRHDDRRLLRRVARAGAPTAADLDATGGGARAAPADRRHPRRGRRDQRADRPRRSRSPTRAPTRPRRWRRCGSSTRCRCASPRRPPRDDIDDVDRGPRQRAPGWRSSRASTPSRSTSATTTWPARSSAR